MVTKIYLKPTYLPTYLCDSSDSSAKSNSKDSSDSSDKSNSSDNQHLFGIKKNVVTKTKKKKKKKNSFIQEVLALAINIEILITETT